MKNKKQTDGKTSKENLSFKERYEEAKTWADAQELVKSLTGIEEARKLAECLLVTQAYTGLNMRQEFLLGILESHIKYYKEWKDEEDN